MKNGNPFSSKRIAIDKASAQMVIVMAVAAFLTVFSLVAANALWGQRAYLSRVAGAKEKAHAQLVANIAAVKTLNASYEDFVSKPANIIGGNPTGTGDKDGDNAKIVLDALPPQYDFPALTSSLEKILTARNLAVSGIGGTDDQIAQQTNTSSPTPVPVTMPFTFSVNNATYASVQDLIDTLQKSIRPIQIDTLALTGGSSSMQVSITAHTYYQPEKDLKITTQVVK